MTCSAMRDPIDDGSTMICDAMDARIVRRGFLLPPRRPRANSREPNTVAEPQQDSAERVKG